LLCLLLISYEMDTMRCGEPGGRAR